MNTLNIHSIIPSSMVDGEGIRYTIFFQGCIHYCKKCHNQETWPVIDNQLIEIDDLLKDILQRKQFIDGVTFTGGEPLLQHENLLILSKLLKSHNINIWLWTGYDFNNIKHLELLNYIDVVIDGRYFNELPTQKLYRGSDNQCLYKRTKNGWILVD